MFSIIIILLIAHGFCGAIAVHAAENGTKVASSERGAVYTYKDKVSPQKIEKVINRVVKLKHISAKDALNIVSRVSPDLIVVDKGVDLLVLRGKNSNIREALKLVRSIDKKASQVLIECKVIEISESAMKNIGINWGKEQGSFKFSVDSDSGKVGTSDDFLITVNALVARGEASLLAQPKITTLDGKQAEINIGSRIPYAVPANSSGTSTQWTVRYIDAGVSLKITSRIRSEGDIISTIRPEVSSVSEWRSTSAGEFPVISTRNADVTVKMKDGKTLAIGGLISKTERENISKIPFFCDVPFFGGVFQRKINEEAKTEVVFFITPRIVD
ncbi:type II secretion system protein GspD [Candidatus Margulisiibacteriota bacterium]